MLLVIICFCSVYGYNVSCLFTFHIKISMKLKRTFQAALVVLLYIQCNFLYIRLTVYREDIFVKFYIVEFYYCY